MQEINDFNIKDSYETKFDNSDLSGNGWYLIRDKTYSLIVSSDQQDARDISGNIIVKNPLTEISDTNTFSDKKSLSLYKTQIIQDPYDPYAENIELKLEDRNLTFLIDQSGSMTWNDNGGLRHTITKRMINRLESVYPGNIKYNILSYGSLPIKTSIVASASSIATEGKNIQDVVLAEFADSENNFAGIRILRKKGSISQSPIDGEIVREGLLNSILDKNLELDENYYYTVFTYDNNGKFSSGKTVSITPRKKVIPRGVGLFKSSVLLGSGVVRDENTEGLWHFDEGQGDIVVDFSRNSANLSLSGHYLWSNGIDVPSGLSAIRLNGSTSQLSSELGSKMSLSPTSPYKTFMGWIYPFEIDQDRIIVARQGELSTNYIIKINSQGGLSFSLDGSAFYDSPQNIITANKWNHFAITVDLNSVSNNIDFYVNGEFKGTSTLLSITTDYSEMYLDIGYNRRPGVPVTFFGYICDISIHNIIRDISYISKYSISKNNISKIELIDNASSDDQTKPTDNGDRVVSLKFFVPNDFNYENVKILRKSFSSPDNIADGNIVYYSAVQPGNYQIFDVFDYMPSSNYYYRIFSQESTGNYSLNDDSPILQVNIPQIQSSAIDSLDTIIIEPINNLNVVAGNKKNYMYWESTEDTNITGVRIYSQTKPFIIGQNIKASGYLVFEGDRTANDFVHRSIDNNIKYYYGIVNVNRFGQISDPVYFTSIPLSSANESLIPLLDVRGLGCELVENNSVNVFWNDPIEFKSRINDYFGSNIYLCAFVYDLYGQPISHLTNISMKLTANLDIDLSQSDNVFYDNQALTVDYIKNNAYTFNISKQSGGIIKAILSMTNSADILKYIRSAKFFVSVYSNIPNTEYDSTKAISDNNQPYLFEYNSKPIEITLINPLSVDLLNRDEKYISIFCEQTIVSGISDSLSQISPTKEEKKIYGSYASATSNFYYRVFASFKGNPIANNSTVRARVYDTGLSESDLCSFDIDTFTSDGLLESQDVIVNSSQLVIAYNTIVNSQSGVEEFKSYIDIPLTIPKTPKSCILYVDIESGGYATVLKSVVCFANPLKISITPRPPSPDGIDIAEQYASVVIVDPDSGSVSNVADLTVVKWNLIKLEGGKNRPFYSTEITKLINEVGSYTHSGVASRVFLGPISNVVPLEIETSEGTVIVGERYKISAKVAYGGFVANTESDTINIEPSGYGRHGSPKFLMTMDGVSPSTLFADGESYNKLLIVKDVNNTSNSFASCFIDCLNSKGKSIYVLRDQQIITLNAPGLEIIYGPDIIETIDPYSGKHILETGENTKISVSKAFVPIDGLLDQTPVYFRINAAIADPTDVPQEENIDSLLGTIKAYCECVPQVDMKPNYITVQGETTVNYNNESIHIVGGGSDKEAVPATIIEPLEPLQVEFIGTKIDNVKTNSLVTDNISINELVFAVSFAGYNVPDGTPVEVYVKSFYKQTAIIPQKTIVHTVNSVDSQFSENTKSYISILLNPISKTSNLNDELITVCRYNKKGTILRARGFCLLIKRDSKQQNDNNINEDKIQTVLSNKNFVYDTQSDTWQQLSSMSESKISFCAQSYNGKIYTMGGLSDTVISKTTEVYDLLSDAWTSKAPMTTERFSATSNIIADNIYVIGGITSLGNSLTVVDHNEVYNIGTDSWVSKKSIPINIAMANSINIGDYIYVIGGVSSLNIDGSIKTFNTSIWKYSIVDNNWQEISIADEFIEIYKRINPALTIDSDGKIVIFIGANLSVFNELNYITEILVFNPITELIEKSNSKFTDIPTPRYKFGFVSDGSNHYVLGGSNEQSRYLNDFEKIDSSAEPYSTSQLESLDSGFSSAVLSLSTINGSSEKGYNYDNISHIFCMGGNTSGRKPGFLSILTSAFPSNIRLRGKQTANVLVELKDENGDYPDKNIDIYVRGFIKTNTSSESSLSTSNTNTQQETAINNMNNKLLIYPVIFSSNEISTSDGRALITLLGRSEDVLENVKNTLSNSSEAIIKNSIINIEEGQSRQPYNISVEITVMDDFYFGQTVDETVKNNDSIFMEPPSDLPAAAVNEIDTTVEKIDLGEFTDMCAKHSATISVTTVLSNAFYTGINIDNISVIKNELNSSLSATAKAGFAIIDNALSQELNPVINYFNDEEWLPQIVNDNSMNNLSGNDAIKIIDSLSVSIPYGVSTLLDAIDLSSEILNETIYNSFEKNIYVFTDNESNMSFTTVDEVLYGVNSIDGEKKTPIVIGNFSTAYPFTLSAKMNTSDTDTLNKLSSLTGGQSITVLSQQFEDEMVGVFVGSSVGSLGYGNATFEISFDDIVKINSIFGDFDLYDNTNGRWRIYSSEDGYYYRELNQYFKANLEYTFGDLFAKNIKFDIELFTSFSNSNSDEYGSAPTGLPIFDQFVLSFNPINKTNIFLNKEDIKAMPQQIVTICNTNLQSPNIKFGVVTNDSSNWDDYTSGSQPSKMVNNKAVIPLRFADNTDYELEKIKKISQCLYKMQNGKYNDGCTVIIYRKTSTGLYEVISENEYTLLSRDGFVVFKTPQQESVLYVEIVNSSKIKVGLQIETGVDEKELIIESIGYMYNTNVNLLPAATPLPPEVKNATILNNNPGIYDIIEAYYEYSDANKDIEDISQTEIKWYINDIYIPYLDNLKVWNDINNTSDPLYSHIFTFDINSNSNVLLLAMKNNESILKPQDKIYFIVKASDGSLFSNPGKSTIATAVASAPIVERVYFSIAGSGGEVKRNPTTSDTIFVKYDLSTTEKDTDISTVEWYVNGLLFKSGKITDTNANSLLPNETINGIVALKLNNEIYCKIKPQTSGAAGESVSSSSIVVKNTIPFITDVSISPRYPTINGVIRLTYVFNDIDVSLLGDGTQSDQSIIKWYKKTSSISSWAEQSLLEGKNTISGFRNGEQWKAIITPYDGLDKGTPVESTICIIRV